MSNMQGSPYDPHRNPLLFTRLTSPPKQTQISRLPAARKLSFAPTPPPGLGPPQWLPNKDGHICELTSIFRRCIHCSWSARMANPLTNTHYDHPIDLEPKYIIPGLDPPPGWPTGVEWTPPYGVEERKQNPETISTFNPTSMIWYSQWEIVFAKTELGLTDEDTCLLYRYRWAAKDPSVKDMQPYHIPQIMNLLSSNYALHSHAFWFRAREREISAREEWRKSSNELRNAKDEEWEARCAEWEAGLYARQAFGEQLRGKIEGLAVKVRALDERTKGLEGRLRAAEVMRRESALVVAEAREELWGDLMRAKGRMRGGVV